MCETSRVYLPELTSQAMYHAKWETNTCSIIKRAHSGMFFLRQLRKLNVSHPVLTKFYRATTESILSSSISVWFGSVSALAKNRLQRIVRTAEKLTGQRQLSVSELYDARVRKRAGRIFSDPSHPGNGLFKKLPSGRRFRAIKTKTTCHLNSFRFIRLYLFS